MTEEERRDAVEHQDTILHVRAVLATASGRKIMKYLFKSFGVAELPEIGVDQPFLSERLGFLRAGNSIFKLVAEAAPEVAGNLLAEVEKERYEQLRKDSQEPGS